MTLIQTIKEVLRQNANKPMSVEEISSEINRRGLYHKQIDGSFVAWRTDTLLNIDNGYWI